MVHVGSSLLFHLCVSLLVTHFLSLFADWKSAKDGIPRARLFHPIPRKVMFQDFLGVLMTFKIASKSPKDFFNLK